MDIKNDYIAYEEENEDDNVSEDTEPTYEEICDAIKNKTPVGEVKTLVDMYSFKQQDDMDALNTITDELWANVVKPFMNECNVILNKPRMEVQLAFARWLYKNTNLGVRIEYIRKLEGVMEELED